MKAKVQKIQKAQPKIVLPEWAEEMQRLEQQLERTCLQAGAMMVVLREIAGHCYEGFEAEGRIAKNECFSNILKEIETVPKDGRRYTEELNAKNEQLARVLDALRELIDFGLCGIDELRHVAYEKAETVWNEIKTVKQ